MKLVLTGLAHCPIWAAIPAVGYTILFFWGCSDVSKIDTSGSHFSDRPLAIFLARP